MLPPDLCTRTMAGTCVRTINVIGRTHLGKSPFRGRHNDNCRFLYLSLFIFVISPGNHPVIISFHRQECQGSEWLFNSQYAQQGVEPRAYPSAGADVASLLGATEAAPQPSPALAPKGSCSSRALELLACRRDRPSPLVPSSLPSCFHFPTASSALLLLPGLQPPGLYLW